jgi:hypothetical protein
VRTHLADQAVKSSGAAPALVREMRALSRVVSAAPDSELTWLSGGPPNRALESTNHRDLHFLSPRCISKKNGLT